MSYAILLFDLLNFNTLSLRGSKLIYGFVVNKAVCTLYRMWHVCVSAQSLFFFTLAAIRFHVIICTSYSISCGRVAFILTSEKKRKCDTCLLPTNNVECDLLCTCTVKVFVYFYNNKRCILLLLEKNKEKIIRKTYVKRIIVGFYM